MRFFLPLWLLTSGCAVLHHVQVGEIDNTNAALKPFEIKVSEMGISLEEAGDVARGLSRNQKAADGVSQVENIISLFQMGPKTGNPVYSENYAKDIIHKIREACPTGKITGLTSIREMRKYPVISGEIVKITGFCVTG